MRIAEIRSEAELQAFRSGWDALLRQSASATIFLTWEWVTAWWAAYGNPGDLRILAALDESGVLRGIAPLRHQTIRRYGQIASALSFIGDGSNDSEYLDFIIASGYERPVMEAFWQRLMDELKRGVILLLNEVPATSLNLPALRSLANTPAVIFKEARTSCGAVSLPDYWTSYLSLLRPRFRTKVRSVLRNLENHPEVRFGFCQDVEELKELLPALFDLHTQRWGLDGKPGVFHWDRKREFYFRLSRLLLERGRLCLSWLQWNGKPLACQYGFRYGNTYFHLQEGYEPAAEHWNIGIGLRAWSIRELINAGIREYDFLGGVGRHKTDWGAEIKHSEQIVLAGATCRNAIICSGPEWEAGARETIKKILPPKVLAFRKALLERKTASAGAATESRAGERFRQSIARCYFHLGLPALTRSLCGRYSLSVARAGRGPGLALKRRTESAARILCYHRVNNEQDPFFPATTTELFEKEMRFIARHYKVVSLSRLIEHLETGVPETVLAITFDDGYQDNYQNAFPILQRYGLPATIFLTTGAIDSREPLWFERLAYALKTTTHEHIDLEIDLPRRFWLRTEAERLACNGALFRLLRSLPDLERRQWLVYILEQLGGGAEERRDRMLTWDQVRRMNRRGVSFGAHTVSHPFISKLSPDRLTWELSTCKQRIQEELQEPVDYFAYPNGKQEDFTDGVKDAIRGVGYQAAFTTIWGLNSPGSDRMELHRGGPWETDVALFAYKLDWYQLVNG
jgi:peptidoglycan/xylan/chitin deacetylase (PgdA/CDA1 family)/CelD/BcsL family acetyltransferase involved in cellulose biosynthesis